jgi:cell division protease FtsH
MTKEERQEYKYDISDERICLYPGYEDFRKDMLLADINMIVDDSSSSSVYNMIYMAVEIAFPVILILVMFSAAKGQFKGTSEKELIQTSDVTFDDIIGHEEIIDDVKFVTELIKDPSKGDKVGAKLPKGLLLVGPPGTGKTLLAKAMAHEADVPFLYQNASGFIEMYVGLGARRVRELFKIARKNAPCILFIDEIDAIGGKRGNAKGTSENEQTIDAILQEMDGFTSRDGVFIIAATNRPDELDEALVRSGRFDRQITVSPPRDWMVRRDLFKHYLNKFSVRDDVDIDSLSKQVSGFTGADIAMICNEASIIAVMHDKDCIDMDCIEEAIDKKIFKGSRSKKNAYEKDRHIIAYHEAGHAVMSWLLHEPIARASIQSTISGVGGAVFNEDKDTLFMTDMDMMNRIMIAYAGRVSEDIKFKNVTTGASNDITQATEIMLQYIEKYGFDREFGLLDISILTKEHLVNSDAVTEKMRTMSLKLYDETYDILNRHYAKVEVLAQKLLEVETLSGSEIEELIA